MSEYRLALTDDGMQLQKRSVGLEIVGHGPEHGVIYHEHWDTLPTVDLRTAAPQAPTEPAGGVIERADRMDEKQP